MTDAWQSVVGQPDAVARLRTSVGSPVHAYLFVGPRGVGKRHAAAVFAGELFAATQDSADGAARDRSLAAREQHPDLHVVSPAGRTFRVVEADEVVLEASRSPIESPRKVVVCDRFHSAEPNVAPKLLKTIEEPPPSVVIILLAEEVPIEHATIASRALRVDFRAVDPAAITEALVADGVDATRAAQIADAAGGSLARARLLAGDESFATRLEAWRSVPDRIDGSGATVATLVEELRALIDDSQAPLSTRHAAEREALAQREEQVGTRGSGRRDLEERHRREVRLHRDDELRSGLVAMASRYHDQLGANAPPNALRRLSLIAEVGEALPRNPNEALLLQALLVRLGSDDADARR